ncbi:DinB family protein [Paenibacillus sp. MMS18-CY102]|uniref:DinB family protein n=1 Tax=Paenibacillus sp. MMS18-CY102 TaxID=2682849 RepID=UPI001365D4C6|nr:DinB family protein [Paenibacillus sp. MMS18-CY102]MWC28586.1 DUF664 domain-containing protein [Paenibacillus sp. MMS18-CY102]
MSTNERLQPSEYAPYFERYTKLVPEGNFADILAQQSEQLSALLEPINEEQSEFRYADGKWSIKEVLGHITDNERIWAYRLLRIARGDSLAYAGYDENQFVGAAQFDRIPFHNLLEEFGVVRKATIHLLNGLPEEAWVRSATLYDHALTVRAAVAVIAGHELHHSQVLKERYVRRLLVD